LKLFKDRFRRWEGGFFIANSQGGSSMERRELISATFQNK